MKKRLVMFGVILVSLTSLSAKYVHGYTKSNGTHVNGYHRSGRNHTKSDNYSTKGNINPYTGKAGTKTYNNYTNYGHWSSSDWFIK